ncbi:hypothetical protein GCM10010872_09260 [Dyella flava]|nr:hypothetical protein GCM10010872_09260 [Dyella flava]
MKARTREIELVKLTSMPAGQCLSWIPALQDHKQLGPQPRNLSHAWRRQRSEQVAQAQDARLKILGFTRIRKLLNGSSYAPHKKLMQLGCRIIAPYKAELTLYRITIRLYPASGVKFR